MEAYHHRTAWTVYWWPLLAVTIAKSLGSCAGGLAFHFAIRFVAMRDQGVSCIALNLTCLMLAKLWCGWFDSLKVGHWMLLNSRTFMQLSQWFDFPYWLHLCIHICMLFIIDVYTVCQNNIQALCIESLFRYYLHYLSCRSFSFPSCVFYSILLQINCKHSRTCLERPPKLATKKWSAKTGGLWWQVQLYWNVGPFAKIVLSVKTGDLSWQWSLKTGFTVLPLIV